MKNMLLGSAIGGFTGKAIGAKVGTTLAKKRMSKGLINKIKYNPKLPGAARRRKALEDKYLSVTLPVGAGTGQLTGKFIGLTKDIKNLRTAARTARENAHRGAGSRGYGSGYHHNSSGFRRSHTDINDLLKPFGSKRKSDFKSKAEVKSAYRSAARKHHPDVGGDAEKFKNVASAYDDLKKTNWFGKLAVAKLSAMRDEMSKIAGLVHTSRAKHAFASDGLNTKVLDTKPLGVNQPVKPMKISKNAGAPQGFRGPRVPSVAGMKGKRTDPINPSLATNA